MSNVQIYDRALCCSTGVCGPQVDPVLPRFAADLEWLRERGHEVDRYNLAQDADQFATNELVKNMLAEEGVACLPLVLVDGRAVSRGDYPSRSNLALWTQTPLTSTPLTPTTKTSTPQPSTTKTSTPLPIADSGDCGGTGCC